MITLEDILCKVIAYNPNLNVERVRTAFAYVSEKHEHQYRMSGDRYVDHLLAVVDILISLRPDEDTIIAALLHGICTLDSFNPDEVKERFGETVLFLINAYNSLSRVRSQEENSESENIRKLFMTVAQDVRVVFIKMADRLHNMQTLQFRSRDKRKVFAKETLDLYVPLAARLGVYQLKGSLEDEAFLHLYPRQHNLLKAELEEYLAEREVTMEDSIKELGNFLAKHGIDAKIKGRVKSLYSIYRKLKIKSRSRLQDLYDIYAIRLVLPDKYKANGTLAYDHVYAVLGLIHNEWKPLPHRFKDYISFPKPNGYRSLHTAVLGLSSVSSHPTEIQIRAQTMHNEAEYGSASHWLYDQDKKRKKLANYSHVQQDWNRSLEVFEENMMEDVGGTSDFFKDRIFVMTPTGEVKDLPKGSTPIDFAYAIHTDIGHRCRMAKVNDAVVPLDRELKNGQMVEIILGSKPNPKPVWLSYVQTNSAKSKIKSYLRSLDKEDYFRKGKEKINQELARLGKPLLDENLTSLRDYNGQRFTVRDRFGLVEEVGNGSVSAATIVKKIFPDASYDRKPRSLKRNKKKIEAASEQSSTGKVLVAGQEGLPYKFAHCCKPKFGAPIVAYITRKHALMIHLQQCKLLRDAREQRILKAEWPDQNVPLKPIVRVTILVKDRVGLLRDITDIISDMNVNIGYFFTSEPSAEVDEREIIVDVPNDERLVELIRRLKRIRDVVDVQVVDVPVDLD